ncbi:MAG: hypothetical protein IPM13_18315 [Phycisphaerales bacterium]|nr:hypothetical protein [Phycisphaerales bacterium]
MKEKLGPHGFAAFEKELHERVMEVERDLIAAEMKRFDVDADAVVIQGKVHRRVLRQSQTYTTAAGEVVVERTLYKDRKDDQSRCVSPMELTIGVVGDFWTPRAAQQALWVVTQMTPKKAEELFGRVGNMDPSKSSLDRLPKLVADIWEGSEQLRGRPPWGARHPRGHDLDRHLLDGVLAPMDGTEVTRRRARTPRRRSAPPRGRWATGRSGAARSRSATKRARCSARSVSAVRRRRRRRR